MFKDVIQHHLEKLDTTYFTFKFKKIDKLIYNLYPFKLNGYPLLETKNYMPDHNLSWFNTAGNIYFTTVHELTSFLEDLIAARNNMIKTQNIKHHYNLNLTLTIPDDQDHIDELYNIQKKIQKLEAENKSNLNTKFINKKSPKANYSSRVVLTMNTKNCGDTQNEVTQFIEYMKDVFGDAVVFNDIQCGYGNSSYYHTNMDFKMYIYIDEPDDAVMLIPHTNHKFVKSMKTEVFLNE